MILIDVTRLSRRKNQQPSGIDRVIIAYRNWLEHSKKPLVRLKFDFYGVSIANEPSRSLLQKVNLSTLQIVAKRIARKRKPFTKLSKDGYNGTKSLDISVNSDRWEISKQLNEKIDPSEQSLFFSIGHDVLIRHSYLEWLKSFPKMKKVFFIHDTIPLDFPEYCRHEESGRHKLRIYNAHIYGDVLIVNSQYTADRLEYWRDLWKLRRVPVHVINIGVESIEDKTQIKPATAETPYFVVLGTIEPRKNHLLLLNVWRSLLETHDPSDIPKLLFIGRMGWEVEMVQRLLDRNPRLQEFVEVKHGVKDVDLWPILKGSRALLFPSFVEGWGMPLVEALHHGVPAICSDNPALREAGQDMADYCSPINGEAWKELIIDYTKHPDGRRAEQVQRIKEFKAPTWEEHFQALEQIIDDL